jgi:glycerophosphoryl diester phosphodiesterase
MLGELIDSVDHYTKANHLKSVYYLIEIKSAEKTDGFDQPAPDEFIDKLMKVLNPKKLGDRLIIQSFDMRPLQVLHKKHPNIALGFLTDDKAATMSDNLTKLGFNPAFYNPYKALLTQEMIDKCHTDGMLIMPWTVNDAAEMKKIKAMNVDGIITDYINDLAGL